MDHPVSCHIIVSVWQSLVSVFNHEFVLSTSFFAWSIGLLILLFASSFLSAAEVAFFSITPAQLRDLKSSGLKSEQLIIQLLSTPKRILATLLISINFVNIAIVVLSSLLISEMLDFSNHPTLGFVFQVVIVTFIIVLFGEVMPKVYAQQNALSVARISIFPVFAVDKILKPFSYLLTTSTTFVEKRFHQKGYEVSVEDLTHAIEITSSKETPEDEKKILKGIARFSDIDVKQIMKGRLDVLAVSESTEFEALIELIIQNRYSRLPVFKNSFDEITGILYTKDLLPFIDTNSPGFRWQSLIRPAYFVPESKKINDLLREFQEKKIHMAVVVDEYGGNSGIVTLEDILEEIVGEINDEFDDEEISYSRLDDDTFVFEGKILLNDLGKIMDVDSEQLRAQNPDVDTLAGLILELKGTIPHKGEEIISGPYRFLIESADRRRIKRVKVQVSRNPVQQNRQPLIFILLVLSMLFSCTDDYIPKPKGFFRITFPEKVYASTSFENCPFSFQLPAYGLVIKDSSKISEPCWFDIAFPQFNATIYMSYKKINNDLEKLYEDHRSITMKHIPKASAIEEVPVNDSSKKLFGSIYQVKGNAASNLQFYLTDSTRHFIRGSLYFNSSPQADSIAPVLSFLSADVYQLVQTFEWR